jgi:membrane protease YdiL (CAAX protease family)
MAAALQIASPTEQQTSIPTQGSSSIPKNTYYTDKVKKITGLAKGCFSYLSRNLLVGVAVSPIFTIGTNIGIQLLQFIPALVPSISASDDLSKHPYLQFVSGLNIRQIVSVGIREELLFRGFFPILINRAGSFVTGEKNNKTIHFISQVASAILFGFAHSSTGMGPLQTISATIAGIAFGILKEKVGILACITTHSLHDFSQIKIMGFLMEKLTSIQSLMEDSIVWRTCSSSFVEEKSFCIPV